MPRVDDLRPLRHTHGLTLNDAASHFNVWPAKISGIERGTTRDDDLTTAYRQWLHTLDDQ